MLFRALFAGRTDVYATRYLSRKTGKHAWSPAEKEYWTRRSDAEREFLPLTDEVLTRHLSRTSGREVHVGLYPMLPDDTCDNRPQILGDGRGTARQQQIAKGHETAVQGLFWLTVRGAPCRDSNRRIRSGLPPSAPLSL
ncbi:hypothetical protein OG589_27445 [Sphaerisporangium sp. NBC_01403]|uniref:TOTE conflict system archaeo-eukaryotic primase domain-containing protein n=1 Tax=Sphaerisporangium sp. NBC_01403 TaxID=2903599 RepID=UPI003251CC54